MRRFIKSFALMLCALLFLFISCASWADVAINETNFPDENFRAYVSNNCDTDGDGYLSDEEISDATYINVYNKNIESLKGVEYFVYLEELYCGSNNLITLDLSKNTALTDLYCYDNQLTTLNLSNNTALTDLRCYDNQLTTLDLSKNTALTDLDCDSNQITTLDLSKNTALTYLNCYYNQLTTLDLSNNTVLKTNNVYDQTINFDASELIYDEKNTQYPYSLNFDSININSSQVSRISDLLAFNGLNKLVTTSIDNNYIYFESYPEELIYNYNTLSPQNTRMYVIVTFEITGEVDGIEIDSTNFPDSAFSTYLSKNFDLNGDGKLSEIEIREIKEIIVYSKDITSLKGIEYFSALKNLYCPCKKLTELDITKNIELVSLDCRSNDLKTLDVSNNTALTYLSCYDNQLTTLDLSNNTTLAYLDCENNQLTTLNLSNDINLISLWCRGNQITELDLKNNSSLTTLHATTEITSNDLIYTGNSSYPYEFDLKSIYVKDSQMSNVKNIQTNISYMTTSTNGTTVYFSSKPAYLYYDYDTQANVDDPYLTVLVTFTGVIDQSSNSNATADDDTPNTNDNKNISPNNNNNNNNAETINNDTEININTNSHAWRYQFDIPAGLSSAIASKFGIDPSLIFQFSDSEIISENWNLNTDDNSAINQLGEQVTIKFPIVKPSNTGVYVMRYSLENSAVGSPLKIRVVSSANSAELNTASLQNIEYAFFDENFNEVTSVPENGIIYATVKMSAGNTTRVVMTTANELATGTITPVPQELRADIIENVIKTLAPIISLDKEDINFIEANNIFDAREPSENLKSKAKKENYDIIGKFNTLLVDKSGIYIFHVTLSDDLFKQINGVNMNDFKIYSEDVSISSLQTSSLNSDFNFNSFNSSFIFGLLNTFECLTMTGKKLEFGTRDFLMVGFLNSGKPLSIYIARIIIALLTGGCNSGFGITGLIIVTVIIFTLAKIKATLHKKI